MIGHDLENNVLKTVSQYDKHYFSYNNLKRIRYSPGTILNPQVFTEKSYELDEMEILVYLTIVSF